ncbi:MAG: hypothetical protein ACPGVT_07980 [Maricaulaceae bacterium]
MGNETAYTYPIQDYEIDMAEGSWSISHKYLQTNVVGLPDHRPMIEGVENQICFTILETDYIIRTGFNDITHEQPWGGDMFWRKPSGSQFLYSVGSGIAIHMPKRPQEKWSWNGCDFTQLNQSGDVYSIQAQCPYGQFKSQYKYSTSKGLLSFIRSAFIYSV